MKKPNEHAMAAQVTLWTGSAPKADRADLNALAEAWGSGVITWGHADKLARGLPGTPLPEAIAMLRGEQRAPAVAGPTRTTAATIIAGPSAQPGNRADAEARAQHIRTLSPAARDRLGCGEPASKGDPFAFADAYFAQKRAPKNT